MNSCDLPPPPNPSTSADLPVPVSRVLRFRPAGDADAANGWEGIQALAYKPAADHHCGVVRNTLIGDSGERTAFHVRYFEIAPGGFTSLERHEHEHVVIVLRGGGEVRLGVERHPLAFGDAVYVAPWETHQLHNPSSSEPFGFLCLVDACRDAPQPVAGDRNTTPAESRHLPRTEK
jgi:quercetin dioxygenase-like cupin family protein